MMRIYIPTRERADRQVTLRQLTPRLLEQTVLVVGTKDAAAYRKAALPVPLLVCPRQGIGPVRQFICDQHDIGKYGPALLMLDDDLRFSKRRSDDPSKFLHMVPSDGGLDTCMRELEAVMNSYAHAGILARERADKEANWVPLRECTRLLRALSYDVQVLRAQNIRFDRMPVMEDFDVALQLLKRGLKNAVLCSYVQNQTVTNERGGCSTYRTLEVQKETALLMCKEHYPFVTVCRRKTKVAWGGADRFDVLIQWRKAYESSTITPGKTLFS